MMRIRFVLALAVLPLFAGCQLDMESVEMGDGAAARKVLIAGTTSDFKQKVVAGVIGRLGTQDYYFKIIGLDLLETEETKDFGAILLVNTLMGGKIDERVRRFLSKDPLNPKAVVFYTSGGEDPKPDFAKLDIRVDAVTSVSASDRVDKRAEELAAVLRARFAP
jgi:hypothetical protein